MWRRALRITLLAAGLLAGWVASAGAVPPLPPVPPVPSVPTLPALPRPVLPPPPKAPQVPPAPTPKAPALPPVSQPSLPVGGGGVNASGNAQSPSSSAQTSSAQSSSRPAKVHKLHFSRDWISPSGPKQRRQTTLIFVLRKSALVEFVVVRVAPDCREVGRFRVRGRPGVNRVRFRGRIGRRVLGPGTYRLKARALPGRRTVIDTRLVVVTRASKDEIAFARSANTCGSSTGQPDSSRSTVSGSGGAPPDKKSAEAAPPSGEAENRGSISRDSGVLGVRFTKRAVDAVKSIPLWLFALLGFAIALLAVAALPLRATPNGRSAAILAHRRGMIALAGAAALVAVTVAYVLR